jgi:hypothetical protein
MLTRIAEISRKLDICGLYKYADKLFKYAEENEELPYSDLDFAHGLAEANKATIYTRPESKFNIQHPVFPYAKVTTEEYPQQDVEQYMGMSLFVLPDGTIIDLKEKHHSDSVYKFNKYYRKDPHIRSKIKALQPDDVYQFVHRVSGGMRVWIYTWHEKSSWETGCTLTSFSVLTPEMLQSLKVIFNAYNIKKITIEFILYDENKWKIYDETFNDFTISDLEQTNKKLTELYSQAYASGDIDKELENLSYFNRFKSFLHKQDSDYVEQTIRNKPMPEHEKTDWSKILQHMRYKHLPVENTIRQESLRGASINAKKNS